MRKFSNTYPKMDNCTHCDQCNAKFKESLSSEERASLLEESDNHKRGAEFARECLKTNEKILKNENSNFVCFTFDLEKMQPIPNLNTSIVFYKRQMWLYKLDKNIRHNNKRHMCIW